MRTIQQLLGHAGRGNDMIYTHVLQQGAKAFPALWMTCTVEIRQSSECMPRNGYDPLSTKVSLTPTNYFV